MAEYESEEETGSIMDPDSDEIFDDEKNGGSKKGRAIKTGIITGIIVLLSLSVLYLLAERNARRYYLVSEGEHILVQRGIFFPVGERRFVPEENDLLKAYEPIPIPAGEIVESRRSFNERNDLDRSLMDQLLSWSAARIDPDQPEKLDQGIYYLRRAEELPSTTAEQRKQMAMMRGRVAFHEGRRLIEHATRNLDNARELLTQARDSSAGLGRESRMLLQALKEPEAALRRALADDIADRSVLPRPVDEVISDINEREKKAREEKKEKEKAEKVKDKDKKDKKEKEVSKQDKADKEAEKPEEKQVVPPEPSVEDISDQPEKRPAPERRRIRHREQVEDALQEKAVRKRAVEKRKRPGPGKAPPPPKPEIPVSDESPDTEIEDDLSLDLEPVRIVPTEENSDDKESDNDAGETEVEHEFEDVLPVHPLLDPDED